MSRDLVLRYEDGEFGPQIVVSQQEADKQNKTSYPFHDINANSVFFAIKNSSDKAKRPHFIAGKWAYDTPINFHEYSNRDLRTKIPNKIITSTEVPHINYKMVF